MGQIEKHMPETAARTMPKRALPTQFVGNVLPGDCSCAIDAAGASSATSSIGCRRVVPNESERLDAWGDFSPAVDFRGV